MRQATLDEFGKHQRQTTLNEFMPIEPFILCRCCKKPIKESDKTLKEIIDEDDLFLCNECLSRKQEELAR